MPKISVVIPHYQDLAGLKLCLASLERQTFPRDQFEIIVSDNASPVGQTAVAAVTRDRAKLVVCAEKGAGPARNAGVAVSFGEILAFIDSDCQADPEWLMVGVAGLAGYDFIGGQVKVLVDDPACMSATEAFEAVFAFDFKTYINKNGFTGAGNMICGRTVFISVGGFLSGVSEDIEWSQRARAKGYRLGYIHDAIVHHPARRTWQELETKWRRVNTEMLGLHRRKGRGRLAWFAKCAVLPVSAVVHTPRVLLAKQLPDLRSRLLALSTLYRTRLWRAGHAFRLALTKQGE